MGKIYILVEDYYEQGNDREVRNLFVSDDKSLIVKKMIELINKDEYGIIKMFKDGGYKDNPHSDLSQDLEEYFSVEIDCHGFLNYYIQEFEPLIKEVNTLNTSFDRRRF